MAIANEAQKTIPTCGYDCAYFYGTNTSSTEGTPPAWCNPPDSSMTKPCLPGEDASRKSCFKPSLKLH